MIVSNSKYETMVNYGLLNLQLLSHRRRSKMDYKKVIAVVLGIVLSIAGALLGYNFKSDICSGEPIPSISPKP